MPITQHRMLALLLAAMDYQTGLERIQQLVRSEAEAVRKGRKSLADSHALLIQAIDSQFIIDNPVESALTIGNERRNLRPAQMRRNDRRAEQQRILRGFVAEPRQQDLGEDVSKYRTDYKRGLQPRQTVQAAPLSVIDSVNNPDLNKPDPFYEQYKRGQEEQNQRNKRWAGVLEPKASEIPAPSQPYQEEENEPPVFDPDKDPFASDGD